MFVKYQTVFRYIAKAHQSYSKEAENLRPTAVMSFRILSKIFRKLVEPTGLVQIKRYRDEYSTHIQIHQPSLPIPTNHTTRQGDGSYINPTQTPASHPFSFMGTILGSVVTNNDHNLESIVNGNFLHPPSPILFKTNPVSDPKALPI